MSPAAVGARRAAPNQERRSKLFSRLDICRLSAVGDPQRRGRTRYAARVDNLYEVAELSKVH